jgi:osmotically-inducible protein OsmY
MPHDRVERPNALIEQAVLQELKWDPLVEEAHIGADVDQGIVTLWGAVHTWGQRHAAAQAAHRVTGVLDVANNIAVEPPQTGGPTDTEIARAVRDALAWNVYVPGPRIKSTVSGGVVTLEGDVDSRTQHANAERAVRTVAGVHAVINLLHVERSSVDASCADSGCACAPGLSGTYGGGWRENR